MGTLRKLSLDHDVDRIENDLRDVPNRYCFNISVIRNRDDEFFYTLLMLNLFFSFRPGQSILKAVFFDLRFKLI